MRFLAPLLLTALAIATFLNGSFFSTYGATHIDLSINLTAAHALRHGDNPYGLTALTERALLRESPDAFIYGQLFTSFIQPPTSGLSLVPLMWLPWREATHAYLVLNHLFLFGSVVLTVYTLRPPLPVPWLVAGSVIAVTAFAQIYMSFSLGQVDASILLLLTLAFWAYTRGIAPIAGAAVAFAAAIKLIPALLLLYFLWKREYAMAIWGIIIGLALFFASLLFVGHEVYVHYMTETVPALLKGSTHFSNASLGAAIARASSEEFVGGIPALVSLSEVPADPIASVARGLVGIVALACLGFVIRRGKRRAKPRPPAGQLLPEFYLVVTAGLLISSVTWEFYVIWLLPVFLAAFLAPSQFMPRGTWGLAALGAFAVLLVTLNYPADCAQGHDCYLFSPNDVFYRPGWIPAVWLERQIGLYSHHLEAVLYLRLTSLLLLAALLAGIILFNRFETTCKREAAIYPDE